MTCITKLALAFTLLLLCIAPIGGLTKDSTMITVTGNNTGVAAPETTEVPTLKQFIRLVKNGDPAMLVGVYVKGQMALPVVQQPSDSPAYVSTESDVVTQFRAASQFDSTGILAHNYLAGQYFFPLVTGQEVVLVYGDGSVKYYQIDEILSYQALSPNDVYSEFVPLQGSQDRLSSTEVFHQTYGQGNNLVLQTCIQVGSEASWGRIFVIAKPIVKKASTPVRPQHVVWDSVVRTPIE